MVGRDATAGGGQDLRQFINKVLAVAPDCAEAKMMESHLMFAEGNYGGVVATAGQILKGDSTHVEALVLRAEAYLHIADLQMAKRHLSEALRFDPDLKTAKALFNSLKKLQKKQSQVKDLNPGPHHVDLAEVLSLCVSFCVLAFEISLHLPKSQALALKRLSPNVFALSSSYALVFITIPTLFIELLSGVQVLKIM
jgi:tetratricopeptide (TPR) repeat protein